MSNKLATITLTVTLSVSIICSTTSFAGLLDGTSWYWDDGRSIMHDLAFYEDHMYVRNTNRQTWARFDLPYSSFKNLNGSITYINFFPDPVIPALIWGRCNIEKGVGSYNAIGLLFFVIPLFDHTRSYDLESTDWVEPKTAPVIASFHAPDDLPTGLAWDGQYLWNADSFGYIYKLDTSGNVIEYFEAPGDDPNGLAWDGEYLWNVEYMGGGYKLDTSGNIIDTFDTPGPAPMGLTWDGEYLWNSDRDENKIYKLDTSGNVIDSFKAPGGTPDGLAWDGEYLWTLSRITLLIYKIDTSGNVIESFYSPATLDRDDPYSFSSGLAWDGEYLWVAHDDLNYAKTVIYKYDVSAGK